MQLGQEEDFPRGGKTSKPTTANEKPRVKIQKQENLFGFNRRKDPKKKKSKKQRSEARKAKQQEQDEEFMHLVEPQVLTYKTIKTDMIILGNVRNVSTVAAEIELPGRIYGYISIGAISDILTHKVQKRLGGEGQGKEDNLLISNFFETGQFLPVKVLQLETTEKGKKVHLSTKPSTVNADFSHTAFKKQMLLWATVAEKLEHGYRLDVGVQNVRTFLQNEKVPEGSNYKIGQNIWCVVHNCNVAPSATTLKVSALPNHIASALENEQDRSLHSVLPGMQFNVDITNVLKNGLLGNFMDQHKAYVHDMYLQKPLQTVSNFREGQEVKARVLYVEPITKIVFFTLRGIETTIEHGLKIGQIISAKVLGRTSGGIYLQLNKTDKGFVTFRRILNSLGKNTFEDITELVEKRYPEGKEVSCRILDYNRLDAVFICAVEAAILKEKFFTPQDLTIGQLVTAEVTEIKDAGLVVKFGHLQGFIDNLHLSNSQYSDTIKSKFRKQQKLKARVLSVRKSGSVRLTIKPALLESDLCLANPDQVEVWKEYPGVVVKRSEFGAVVAFYGEVSGFIHSSKLLPGEWADARDVLFDGQVVNVTVIGRMIKGLDLSLIPVRAEELENVRKSKKEKMKRKAGNGEEAMKKEKRVKNGILERVSFVEQQGVVEKVCETGNEELKLTAELSEVFDYKVESSFQILEQYLSNIERICSDLKDSGHALTGFSLGQRVSGVVKKVTKEGGCTLSLENEVLGVVEAYHCTDGIKKGMMVKGVVLWVDYVENHVEISLDPKVISSISENQDGFIGQWFVCKTTSEIVLIKENFALCTSGLNKQLVFIPTKIHENRFSTFQVTYKTMLGRELELSVYKRAGGRLVGFLDAIAAELNKWIIKVERNLEKPKSSREKEEKFDGENESCRKRKLEATPNGSQNKRQKQVEEKELNISFPSMANFFSTDDVNAKQETSLSDNEISEDSGDAKKKKKKLTPAERVELAKQEEERIRQIENELADPTKAPETAEQFDRLVLANPNSSKIWAQYIAFHLSTAEVEKARAVVKRALDTIHLDQFQDKLNIWIAYLNLENLFGTKESFGKVFEEATRCNDPYNIYLETIRMFAEARKFEEMEEKMKKFRGKFKNMPKTWVEMARVHYELERFEEARKLKEGALKSITDKKQHIDMLVQFAIMEFKYGEQNQGEVLFETILSSYASRVDVWSSYVDQLVKKGCIDSARRVLERATAQKLSLMKMRSLFKKFRDFEKAHGTEESLQQVKEALTEYVARVKGTAGK